MRSPWWSTFILERVTRFPRRSRHVTQWQRAWSSIWPGRPQCDTIDRHSLSQCGHVVELAVVFTCSSQMTSNGEHLSIHVFGHWHVFYEAPIQGPRTFLTELSIDCSVVEFFLLMYARHESAVRSTHHKCFLEVPGLASLCHESTWWADLWVPIFQSFLYSLCLLSP